MSGEEHLPWREWWSDTVSVPNHYGTMPGTRYRAILECPPRYVLLRFGTLYHLPLPWTYAVITAKHLPIDASMIEQLKKAPYPTSWRAHHYQFRVASLFGRPAPIADATTDLLYWLPLPNQYPASRTFCNNLVIHHSDDALTTEQIFARAINSLWETGFSYWRDIPPLQTRSGVVMLHRWEACDLSSVLEFPWGQQSVGTLAEIRAHYYFASDLWV